MTVCTLNPLMARTSVEELTFFRLISGRDHFMCFLFTSFRFFDQFIAQMLLTSRIELLF